MVCVVCCVDVMFVVGFSCNEYFLRIYASSRTYIWFVSLFFLQHHCVAVSKTKTRRDNDFFNENEKKWRNESIGSIGTSASSVDIIIIIIKPKMR